MLHRDALLGVHGGVQDANIEKQKKLTLAPSITSIVSKFQLDISILSNVHRVELESKFRPGTDFGTEFTIFFQNPEFQPDIQKTRNSAGNLENKCILKKRLHMIFLLKVYIVDGI